jgi:preprotein translocase subunit SecF
MSDRTDPDTAIDAGDLDVVEPPREALARTGWGRLYRGQTAIDFYGRRRIGYLISLGLIVITVVSLVFRGLNLGIDFTGGVSWDMPAANVTTDEARIILGDNGIDPESAKIQTRSSESGDILRVQVADQTDEVREAVKAAFAEAGGLALEDVSVTSVSSSWGRDITEKAVRALVIFLILVSLFIAVRFVEWRMAMAAIIAMVHDVAISVGIYSVFGFEVTPETVIAFLTILGYSLYDTIVVFDRVRENERRFEAARAPYSDVVNVSMNQVVMRSLNTSFSSVLPVLAMLVIGAGLLGAVTLRLFAIALLVGMLTGAYSSIFIAAPLVELFKKRTPRYRSNDTPHAVGEELRRLVLGGSAGTGKRRAQKLVAAAAAGTAATEAVVEASPAELLTHAPRPRKKKRR